MNESLNKVTCDIVVPLWNKVEYTKNFVKTLVESTHIPIRVIFVDNNSTDETRQYLKDLEPTDNCFFEIITNDTNLGFIKGVNKGLEIADAEYVCIANNDLEFSKNWLEEIINVFKFNPSIGLVNPNSNNLGVRIQKSIGLDEIAKLLKDKEDFMFKELNFCIGFCMITTQKVFSEVGFLSEEFLPMFFEDTDYSLRVQQKGYMVGVAKRSYVWHAEHASMGQLGKEKEKIFRSSKKIFEKKWGRILRIAIVCKDKREVSEVLKDGLDLGKFGNYVTFFVKDDFSDEEKIFKDQGLKEFSNFSKKRFLNIFFLAWHFILKKKKYDIVISRSRFLAFILKFMKCRACERIDFAQIQEIKSQGV